MTKPEAPTTAAVGSQLVRGVRPRAWLCELAQEDGTTRTQFVEQDPDGLRWNDVGEPSPYRTTPLYAMAPELAEYLMRHLLQERAALNGFLKLGNEKGRAKGLDAWIACLAGPNAEVTGLRRKDER